MYIYICSGSCLSVEADFIEQRLYGAPNDLNQPLTQKRFDLAIKMMFNFDVESVAPSIWREMENELVPAKMAEVYQHMGEWQNGYALGCQALDDLYDTKTYPYIFGQLNCIHSVFSWRDKVSLDERCSSILVSSSG